MNSYTTDTLNHTDSILSGAGNNILGGSYEKDLEDPFIDESQELTKSRQFKSQIFGKATVFSTYLVFFVLAFLIFELLRSGLQYFDWQFLTSYPSRHFEKAGIFSALIGTICVIGITILFAVPIGIGAGVYFEEFLKNGKFKNFIDINIANLAGIPSIIYGILGLAVFVRFFSFERSVLSAGLTLCMLTLPIIIISTREALKGIPQSIRHAAYGVGATKLDAVRTHVLPNAMPGILTGIILSISRAVGETAPLIIVGAATFVPFLPEGIFDEFTTLPIQIYNWASRPQAEFHSLAAAGIICLLIVLLTTNAAAIYYRNIKQRKNPW